MGGMRVRLSYEDTHQEPCLCCCQMTRCKTELLACPAFAQWITYGHVSKSPGYPTPGIYEALGDDDENALRSAICRAEKLYRNLKLWD